jgi:carboxyl-terminal processing protease
MAAQLFNTNLHARIKASSDAMIQKVLELDQPSVRRHESSRIEANN